MSTMEDALSKHDTVELPDELKNSLSKIKKKNLSEKGIDSLLESIRAYLEY